MFSEKQLTASSVPLVVDVSGNSVCLVSIKDILLSPKAFTSQYVHFSTFEDHRIKEKMPAYHYSEIPLHACTMMCAAVACR